ncbi:MAG: hypothetical protein OXI33_02810 [Chloroflexota bacterium]|nr:hypothetical protein [Chloroflexota bacterium]
MALAVPRLDDLAHPAVDAGGQGEELIVDHGWLLPDFIKGIIKTVTQNPMGSL